MRMRCAWTSVITPIVLVVWGAMLSAFFCLKDEFTLKKADAFSTRRHFYLSW
jgi:hypothetical protein